MRSKQQYFYNALLLTLVTLLMRTVSVAFNVYVSGKVGSEAMGLLSLISGVYGFAVTLATSGVHLATVRTLAACLQRSGGAENRRALLACLQYATFFGTLATLLLACLAAPIGRYALKDPRTVRALYLLSATLLPTAVSAVFNGYFTAMRRAYKNAVATVTEQAIKITFTGYLLVAAAPRSVEGSVLAIFLGGAVAELASLLCNLLLYALDKRHFKGVPPQKHGERMRVARIALPVAISAYMRSGLLTIEHILIPRGLQAFGKGNSAALASYGALHGMALPVVLYPAAILSSFAGLLIPEITEQHAAGNKREIRYIAGRVYQTALLFSIGVSAVMLAFSGGLGRVLYQSSEVAYFIKMLAPLIPIMYIDSATDAILKGMGEQVYSMNVNILDATVSVILVWLLVPRLGINGYLITIYITEILNAACSIVRMLRVSGFRPRIITLLLRPLLCAVAATAAAKLVFAPLLSMKAGGFVLALQIFLVVLVYFFLLFLTNTVKTEDIKWLFFSLSPAKNATNSKK